MTHAALSEALDAMKAAHAATLDGTDALAILDRGMAAVEAALANPCSCKDRPAKDCPGEWEPGCDLGANPRFVSVAPRVDFNAAGLSFPALNTQHNDPRAGQYLVPVRLTPVGAGDGNTYAVQPMPVGAMPNPVAWIRTHPDGSYTSELLMDDSIEPLRKTVGCWTALYPGPKPSQ